MNAQTLALDVYGTLINPHAIVTRLREVLGDGAETFSQLWRSKQLEYSFRRGLMGDYKNFSVVTRDALEYTNAALSADLSEAARDELLDSYTRLDAYDDVPDALDSLRAQGRSLYAFSNGFPPDLQKLMANSGIAQLLDGIVSVHDVRSFKPDPNVYAHFTKTTGALPQQTCLVSSNAFDIAGARACGWNTAWVKRDPAMVFDGWGSHQGRVIESLSAL